MYICIHNYVYKCVCTYFFLDQIHIEILLQQFTSTTKQQNNKNNRTYRQRYSSFIGPQIVVIGCHEKCTYTNQYINNVLTTRKFKK